MDRRRTSDHLRIVGHAIAATENASWRSSMSLSVQNLDRSKGAESLRGSKAPCEVIPETSSAPYFAFEHRGFEISIISDGYLEIPEEIFTPEVAPRQRSEVLARMETVGRTVHAPANIPVLRYRDELILFDVGGGDKYQATDGRFFQNLQAAGFDPAAVTKVVVTHAHPDHTGATLACDGSLTFPNATYFVGAAEWDYWMDPEFFSKAPEAIHDFGRGAQRDLGAVRNRTVMIKPGDDVIAGIRAIDTAGHTPGHLSFEIAGDGGLIIAVDAATSEIVAVEHPDWHFGYDSFPELAVRSRRRLLDRASTDKTKLLGFHWTYPGVGFVEPRGNAYRFVPVA
ncbi:MBL fold metallo-hydrolase [Bradyrhizobium sp. CCBAU 53338]|nr:MBL fold metallo-hydrolase [Bradyrhizobium sp. CCBAU 53338]